MLGKPSGAENALIEQCEVDDIAHPQITLVARVKMVAAIVNRQHLRRPLRIPEGGFEIDHRVKRTAVANPVVERQTFRFALRRIEARKAGRRIEIFVLERQRGATENLQTMVTD